MKKLSNSLEFMNHISFDDKLDNVRYKLFTVHHAQEMVLPRQ